MYVHLLIGLRIKLYFDRNEIVKRIVRTAPDEGPWTGADTMKMKSKFRMCSVCLVDLTETIECSHCQVNAIMLNVFT